VGVQAVFGGLFHIKAPMRKHLFGQK